ncbi:ABC transporter permease [Clostridium sp. WILCCON 0269]|uniref:ABC transporter permease n=1 Tax=Candidatus Clostridium eludens TaxID=3381663 RepID=A0ABW8SPH3_9CLOT
MKFSDCLKMAFSDLGRRKIRTVLTSFGIAIGAMLVVLMAGFGQGIQKIAMDQIKQMDTMRIIEVKPEQNSSKNSQENKSEFKKIDNTVLDKFKSIKNVEEVSASIDTQIQEAFINGKEISKVNVKGSNLELPIFLNSQQNEIKTDKKKTKKYGYNPIIAGKIIKQGDEDSVLLGQSLVNKAGIKDYKSIIGKNIEMRVYLPSIPGLPLKDPLIINAKVSGVVNKNYDNGKNVITASSKIAAKIQQYYTEEQNYMEEKGYNNISVEVNTTEGVEGVDSSIKKMGYVTNSQIESTKTLKTMMTIIKVLLTAAGIVVLLVASIGVINTMTMAVYEKTKSIGIMKAQGASRKNISRMFTVQAGSLGFIGGLFGGITALVLGIVINKIVVMYNIGGIQSGMKIIDVNISVFVFTLLFTILVSVAAGMVPARRASKLNPVDSLRNE